MGGNGITVIVCGAPLTQRAPEVVSHLVASGWLPTVVSTPCAEQWLDSLEIERLTGIPPRSTFRSPRQAKAGRAAAVLVCPATFNTINKAAAGAADTYALAQLCEALGSSVPTVVVPMVNDMLWGHPAWTNSLSMLQSAGALFVDVQSGELGTSPVRSGTGDAVVNAFDPGWVSAALPTPAR